MNKSDFDAIKAGATATVKTPSGKQYYKPEPTYISEQRLKLTGKKMMKLLNTYIREYLCCYYDTDYKSLEKLGITLTNKIADNIHSFIRSPKVKELFEETEKK